MRENEEFNVLSCGVRRQPSSLRFRIFFETLLPQVAYAIDPYSSSSAQCVVACLTLRVQVPNNHILNQNLHQNYYYQNPKYLIIGYLDPFYGDPFRWLRHCLDTSSTRSRFRLGPHPLLGGSWALSKWVNHGIIGVTIWLIGVINLLTKSGDPPSSSDHEG